MLQLKKAIGVLVEKGNWLVIGNNYFIIKLNDRKRKTIKPKLSMFRLLCNCIVYIDNLEFVLCTDFFNIL